MYKFLTYALSLALVIAVAAEHSFAQKRQAGSKRPTARKNTEIPIIVTYPWQSDEIPDSLKAFDADIRNDEYIDKVLNLMRFGKASIDVNELELAEKAFDEAIRYIEAIDADDKTAKQARSTFTYEGKRFFKGETYERSLAYFYRGVLYFNKGDYENARACFRSAQFHDQAAINLYSGDMMMMYYLEGKCNQALGELQAADDIFKRAAMIYQMRNLSKATLPSTNPESNIIVIIESGPSIIKYGFGKYNETLEYARNLDAIRPSDCGIIVNNKEIARSKIPVEDTFYQALTRGERIADAYNKGKANFKSFSAGVGIVGISAGGALLTSNDSGTQMVGLGLMLLGALASATSASAKPNADVRYWDNIPESYHLFPLKATEPFTFTVNWFDSSGNVLYQKRMAKISPDVNQPQIVLVTQHHSSTP
jgi:tetratricopeptide (TPR) repeat protein